MNEKLNVYVIFFYKLHKKHETEIFRNNFVNTIFVINRKNMTLEAQNLPRSEPKLKPKTEPRTRTSLGEPWLSERQLDFFLISTCYFVFS